MIDPPNHALQRTSARTRGIAIHASRGRGAELGSLGKTISTANMGVAHFIVLERKIDGLDTGMDGKSLSRHIESLDEAARELGVRPLSEFFSADPKQMAEFMEGEGIPAGDEELPPLQQFTAQDGLVTVQALAAHAAARADGVAQDLRECERILSVAAQHGVGWHFEIDI